MPDEFRTVDEQCWVELTRGQINDLLSMTMDRLALVEAHVGSRPELAERRVELITLKGALLLGRDDPGASR
jgi:hypothetical protein